MRTKELARQNLMTSPAIQSDTTKSLAPDFFARITGEELEREAKTGKLPAWFNKEP